MLEIFIISTIFTTITTIILAISLRKYQISIYKKDTEFRHAEDDHIQEKEQKQNIIEQHELQLSQLEKKIAEFDQNNNHEQTTEFEQKISDLNITNQELNIKLVEANKSITEFKSQINDLSNRKPQHKINIEEFLLEIDFFQKENFEILNNKKSPKELQINSNQNNIVELHNIFNATNLQHNLEYIASHNQDTKQITYSILFAGNNQAYLIDAQLANFLIDHNDEINHNLEQIKDNIKETLKSRIDFLTNEKLQTNILKSINKMDNININQLHPCFYLPSEDIKSMLLTIDPDLFSYATERDIYDYSPSGIVNVILYAKQNLSSETNIIKYQALGDIIKNSYETKQEDESDDKNEDGDDFDIEAQHENQETDNINSQMQIEDESDDKNEDGEDFDIEAFLEKDK